MRWLGLATLSVALLGCMDGEAVRLGSADGPLRSGEIAGDFAGATGFVSESVPSGMARAWGDDGYRIRVNANNPSRRQFGMHQLTLEGVARLAVGDVVEASGGRASLLTCQGSSAWDRASNEERTDRVDVEVLAGPQATAEVVWTARFRDGRSASGTALFDAPGGVIELR